MEILNLTGKCFVHLWCVHRYRKEHNKPYLYTALSFCLELEQRKRIQLYNDVCFCVCVCT